MTYCQWMLAQKEYGKGHKMVALRVHWELCRKYGLQCTNTYQLQSYGEVRITWDMTIFMDKQLKHNCPDSTVVHKDIVTGVNTY